MDYAGQAAETWRKPGRESPAATRDTGLETSRLETRKVEMETSEAEARDRESMSGPPANDEERERMMLEHMPAVRWTARRIHERLPQHVDMEDLVSAGTLGLLDAFRKFDPAKKVQFRSYAQFRIRGRRAAGGRHPNPKWRTR